jgi:hypothetical protein
LIVIVLMGILMPVLAMAFSVVVRTSPTSEARADDSRSLTNLTNWISQDVSSTSEDGFFIGVSAPDGGCVLPPTAAGSVNLLELHWKEGAKRFVSNYRFVSNSPADGKGRIFRYACLKGGSASELRMTATLNEVASVTDQSAGSCTGSHQPRPHDTRRRIARRQGRATRGLDLRRLRNPARTPEPRRDDHQHRDVAAGRQRRLRRNEHRTDSEQPVDHDGPRRDALESLPAIDPDGDLLFTTFPGPQPIPPAWNLLATGTTVEITPDPLAGPGTYPITYRVTDPSGLTAHATLSIEIVPPSAGNLPPIAQSVSVTATRSQESVATLTFSDP